MPLYDRPVRLLMPEMIDAFCHDPGQTFTRQQAIQWFKERYPKVLPNTIVCHLIRFCTNAPSRYHYSVRRPEEDLLFQVDSANFRRYEPSTDPPPLERNESGSVDSTPEEDPETELDPRALEPSTGKEFAYEHDLRDFLAKNLSLIEPGLRLHNSPDGFNGIEFPVGGRFIDILSRDSQGGFIVIELKVSRGYDRTVGQLLRYMAWINKNLAGGKTVRGIIVAREISEDLILACTMIKNVSLLEYELAVTLRCVMK